MFTDVAPREAKSIVSQRKAVSMNLPTLATGSIVNGTVSGIKPFGVFVEVEGGHSGLLHVSKISSKKIDNVEKAFSVGQSIKVMIEDHDPKTFKLSLSTKHFELEPGDIERNAAEVFRNAEQNIQLKKERKQIIRDTSMLHFIETIVRLGGENRPVYDDPNSTIESILASTIFYDDQNQIL